MEQLGTSSSIGSDDDDWIGIYADTYLSFSWIYITDADEALPWCHSINEGKMLHFCLFVPYPYNIFMAFKMSTDAAMQNYQHKQKTFCDITDSENEFHTKYEVVINNIVHRRMSLELQKCLSRKSFRKN